MQVCDYLLRVRTLSQMMPATIYAVAGGKGGVGKTTTAANLAATLRATGREVLLVDTDLAMSNLQDMIGLSHEPTLHDVLGGTADLSDAIIHESEDVLDTEGRLDILPGSTELDAFANAAPEKLPDVIDSIAPEYDTVILDTASGVTPETAIPLQIADQTIIVTEPDEAAVQDAKKTVNLVEHAGGRVGGLVVSRTCLGLDEEEIIDRIGIEHLATVPDLDVPGVDPLAPYRRLVVRLLIGREVAADPETVLDIDPGETPRITSTLEPTPEPEPVVEGIVEEPDESEPVGPETPESETADPETADTGESGMDVEVTTDGGAVETDSETDSEADEELAEEDTEDEPTVTVESEDDTDSDRGGRINRFVNAFSSPSGR